MFGGTISLWLHKVVGLEHKGTSFPGSMNRTPTARPESIRDGYSPSPTPSPPPQNAGGQAPGERDPYLQAFMAGFLVMFRVLAMRW